MSAASRREEAAQVAEALNEWVGGNFPFSADRVLALVWALAQDEAARAGLQQLVEAERADYEREMEEANGR